MGSSRALCGPRNSVKLHRVSARPRIGSNARCRRARHPVAMAQQTDGVVGMNSPTNEVSIDNQSSEYTVVKVTGQNHPGLLTAVTCLFRDLGMDVLKADVSTSGDAVNDAFYIVDVDGKKIVGSSELASLEAALKAVVDGRPMKGRPSFAKTGAPERGSTTTALMDTYLKNDVLSIQESIVSHVEYTLARSRYNFDDLEAYLAAAHSLRDRLIEVWNDTQTFFREANPKRVYYLSMEFLMGRSLTNALYNLDVQGAYNEAISELGYDLEKLATQERDAALGNGGLGRLAACFLDSMATQNLPAWGYGIRYQYGMFRQSIKDGFQHEQPDYWLMFGNPWEIERLNVTYNVKFYGHVSVHDEAGKQVFRWNAADQVTAVAHDNPIPGFNTRNTINLRLWAAKPDKEFDLEAFNTGDYVQAILAKQRAETLSSVLYPDDRTYEGKELRLKQQHFFVSATLQDVVRRFKESNGSSRDDFDAFPDKVAFQLNDTHPTIAIPELMRLLMDENGLGWTRSWEITQQVFAFTNHTVMPEALERWPVTLMERLLPRHMQIIYDINWRFLQQLRSKFGDDWGRISRMSIIEDGASGEKLVRMAYLGVITAHTVNGVAAIHSDILREDLFREFAELWPDKFTNITNGVTQRRWLAFCNEPLRELISERLGSEEWIRDLPKLRGLEAAANDEAFLKRWAEVKLQAKQRAAVYLKERTGVTVNPDVMFDVQVKRIHEYKRQLLNVLGIIHRYLRIKEMTAAERSDAVPRVVVIGGKAAPGYDLAKRIIKLVCAVADKVNADKDIGDLLKVVFMPDYNVSSAEMVIPASELSQHISTAGTEASGTSNMKFCMNGSLIVGTMDGANVEIAEEIGADNMFIFGARKEEVSQLRANRAKFEPPPRFTEVVGLIKSGHFGWQDYFAPLMDTLETTDHYLVANDFQSYIDIQDKIDEVYKDQMQWQRMSVLSTAGSGFFSSDRTIRTYNERIWKCEPCVVPVP
eukprot:jgi/Ulvmu1/9359/UM050_0111.1